MRITLLFLLLACRANAFSPPVYRATSIKVECRVEKFQASQSALFGRPKQLETVQQPSLFSSINWSGPVLATMAGLIWLPLKAFSYSTTMSRKWVRPALLAVALFSMLSSTLETVRVRKRQSLDATSEWGRYASKPAARGRAVLMICIRLLPLWIRQMMLSSDGKSRLRRKSGDLFADSLLKLGPLYIKLGQIVSCRENLLPSEWITALEKLQDRVPAKTGQEALELGYAAMGSQERFDQVFSEFDAKPLAAASLGQVHRAVLRGSNDTVAVKLQRPLLRQIYDQDLALMTKIARVMDSMGGKKGQLGGVSQSWTNIFEDAKDILYREIDYRDEADNSIRISNDFGIGKGGKGQESSSKSKDGEILPSAAPWLRVPYIYKELSSEQALVMEFVPTIKINDLQKLDEANVTAEDREYLADSLARAYLRSFCTNRFFSTDPHPGNLGVEITADGKPRLVMYDFGQACALKPDQAEGILDVIEAIVDMNANRCVDAFATMGVLKENANLEKVRAKVQDNFETGKIQVKKKKLKKAGYKFKNETNSTGSSTNSTSTEQVKDAEVMSFFTLPAEYAFVARAISQMDGVGKTLDPDFDFISSAAPQIVEIKGATNYLSDEWSKMVQKWKDEFFGTN